MEALLSHFFSPHLKSYYKEDVIWFLKFINRNWTIIHPIKFKGMSGIMSRDSNTTSTDFSNSQLNITSSEVNL